jgi:hypothetical protein
MKPVHLPFFFILIVSLGCAGASSYVINPQNAKEMVKPSVLVVETFDFHTSEVAIDETGPGFMTDDGNRAEKRALGLQVAKALAEQIVVEVKEKGIDARRGETGISPPVGALVVRGQFLEINEGDQMSRVVVGFGAGTESLSVRVQIYQLEADGGLLRVREAMGEAHGDKMPGLLVPVGAGAVAGSALRSVVVSGALNTLSEYNAGLASAAKNLAEQFAERSETIYSSRGWLD